ncbi:hypothetical protein DUNSADRAFT_15776 [Dunaliella salina]|uniref:Uncharacterized protein n=1 Tax=Dunaliella salina TaxID=3046 RepID=A0ABQ7H9F3_DUNSA|nr:hypothetical protein DUNSADRAFT_15776 [Dunaliella salina]|eukprot:KAF5843481.1 hypothetical protein DUNSADRAFT_15776 [Dunaliella salina]
MDANAKARLREAIQGLQHGDLQQKPPSTNLGPLEQDQSIPWGLAWHIAAQKEAASVGLPQHSSGRKRKALGLHQGPAAFTKNRNRAGLQGDPASGQRVDPFGRTTLGPTQPQEQSWRAAVSATPAAYQSLVPQNDLYGDPKVHGASVPLPQPPFPRKPPTTTAAAAGAAAAGGAATQELPARLFTDAQDAESTTSGRSTAAGRKKPPLTAPAGWGSTYAPRLTDVPRSFWRTVAPDVHHEILQHEFEKAQEYEQQNPLHAMLAAMRAKRALAQGDGLQQGPAAQRTAARATEAAATAAAAATIPTKEIGGVGDAPVELKKEGVPRGPEPNPWQERDKARAEQAVLAAEMMSDATQEPTHIFRGPGARARSRWYCASGEWEWRPCTVISFAPDGSSFAIRWEPENEVARGALVYTQYAMLLR